MLENLPSVIPSWLQLQVDQIGRMLNGLIISRQPQK